MVVAVGVVDLDVTGEGCEVGDASDAVEVFGEIVACICGGDGGCCDDGGC